MLIISHNDDYFVTLQHNNNNKYNIIIHYFMRRISNLNRVLDVVRNYFPLETDVEEMKDNSLVLYLPYWPSLVNGLLSSRLHVAVYAFDNFKVRVCIDVF